MMGMIMLLMVEECCKDFMRLFISGIYMACTSPNSVMNKVSISKY